MYNITLKILTHYLVLKEQVSVFMGQVESYWDLHPSMPLDLGQSVFRLLVQEHPTLIDPNPLLPNLGHSRPYVQATDPVAPAQYPIHV